MKLEEAIADCKEILNLSKPLQDKDYKPALRLGIEALRRIRDYRVRNLIIEYEPLPGETRD